MKAKTKKKVTFYKDYFKFAKRVGILEEEHLKALGWDCDNGNRICPSDLDKLINFVAKLNDGPCNAEKFIEGIDNKKKKPVKRKKYHICTDYDACDAEDAYCEEKGIDPEDENRRVVATVMDNRIGFVNRMDYFLCDGDDSEEIMLEEVEEV